MRDDEPSAAPQAPQPPSLDHLRPEPAAAQDQRAADQEQDDFLVQAPAVSLPQGGGAVQPIGETFQTNPVTGTGSFTVPVAISPGRQGFGPSLALAYDSGAGNGPFGHGWSVGISSIRRKTSRGLPQYDDAPSPGYPDSDVFVIAGAEDLVPTLDDSGDPVSFTSGAYTVQRFRPRVEGGFSRVERWRHTNGTAHWRTRDRDNVVRIYGRDDSGNRRSRVADPNDPSRVFEWLLEEVRDELGNIIVYTYQVEDRARVGREAYEHARTLLGHHCTYVYPKRIRYGNRSPTADADTAADWAFEVVFDYGEHTANPPTPDPDQDWPVRQDPFSSFRSGFDLRCYRLCDRILMFHRFSVLGANPVLVRSTELAYAASTHLTKLTGVTHRGWPESGGLAASLALPEVRFTYLDAEISQTVEFVQGLDDIAGSMELGAWQWIDLDGEGLSGLLSEQGRAWTFKRNEGEGQLGAVQELATRPNASLRGGQLMDLGGDGKLDFVRFEPPLAGYHPRSDEGGWAAFEDFDRVPTVSPSDPSVRVLDVDGDGFADLLVTDDDRLCWFPSRGKEGFGAPRFASRGHDEDLGPTLLFQSQDASIFLGDMTGDGLTDLVRIEHGRICYWPNRGYGWFGAKITMEEPPRLDHADQYDPRRIRLADVDGTGPLDIVYIGATGIQISLNQSGNGWSPPQKLDQLPPMTDPETVQVADLRGDGTACLVWAAPVLGDGAHALQYVRLMAKGKPHLMTELDNGLGRITRMTYAPSTKFYLADRRAGAPWATRLSFPVHVLERVEIEDQVTGWRFTNTFAYHHGYFDGHEREFRGFGMVEQRDTESVGEYEDTQGTQAHVLDPVVTKTWFHTGAWLQDQDLQATYAAEGWTGDTSAPTLAPSSLPDGLTPAERREATRALRGRVLRQEVYAEDNLPESGNPYTVATTRYEVRQLQPMGEQRHGVYLVVPAEARSAHYERTVDDPRVSHQLTLEVDEDYGDVLLAAAVGYPRRGTPTLTEQSELHVVVSQNKLVHDDQEHDRHHLSWAYEQTSWELTGDFSQTDTVPFTVGDLKSAFDGANARPFESDPSTTLPPLTEKRALSETRIRYQADNGSEVDVSTLTSLQLPSRRLVHQTYQLAFPHSWVSPTWGTRVSTTMLAEAGYVQPDGPGTGWYRPSGTSALSDTNFYQPDSVTDPFGNTTTITWDADGLLPTAVTDAVDNVVTATTIDYRLLAATTITDANDQERSVVVDALGRVTATSVVGKNGEGDTTSEPYSTTITYDLDSWRTSGTPASIRTKAREQHGVSGSRWQEQVAYSDGGGNVVLAKAKAWPGDAPKRDATTGELVFDVGGNLELEQADPRWIGTGRVLVDNKGNPIKQYEPFFTSLDSYEDEADIVEQGVSPALSYDPLGRLIRTDLPDGTYERVVFSDPWVQQTWDRCDNLTGSDWESARTGSSDPLVQRSLTASQAHAGTPAKAHLDALGRLFRTEATPFAVPSSGTHEYYVTTVAFDVLGNPVSVTDARGNVTQADTHDAMQRAAYTSSPDAGDTWVLLDIAGQPVYTWKEGDPHEVVVHRTYDELRRPVGVYISDEDVTSTTERLHEYTVYGDLLVASATTSDNDKAEDDNLRGRPWRVYDGAGLVEIGSYDFKGNPQSSTRTFLDDVDTRVAWNALTSQTNLADLDSAASGDLLTESWTTSTTYDAVNRVVTQTTPDDSETRPTYNDGGLLESVHVDLRGGTDDIPFVHSIDYNARGQRVSIGYHETTFGGITPSFETTYEYDPFTHRLTRLKTQRDSDVSSA